MDNDLAYEAHKLNDEFGYTMREVAETLGQKYDDVQKALKGRTYAKAYRLYHGVEPPRPKKISSSLQLTDKQRMHMYAMYFCGRRAYCKTHKQVIWKRIPQPEIAKYFGTSKENIQKALAAERDDPQYMRVEPLLFDYYKKYKQEYLKNERISNEG